MTTTKRASIKRTASPKAKAPVPAPRTSDAAVKDATGRDRAAWFTRLDKWGAADRTHRDIADWLVAEQGVDNWWAQTLTVDYEQARGLRAPGGMRDGTFTVNASKTVAVPVTRLFNAFTDAKQRARWLPGRKLTARTAQPDRSARFAWDDGTSRILVSFTAKGDDKSQAAVAHERLPDAAAAEKAKTYWRDRMTALKDLLEG